MNETKTLLRGWRAIGAVIGVGPEAAAKRFTRDPRFHAVIHRDPDTDRPWAFQEALESYLASGPRQDSTVTPARGDDESSR